MVIGHNDIGVNALSFDGMWVTYNRRLYDIGMHIDSIFYLCRTDAVARDVEHVIDASSNFIIAFRAAITAVAREIFIGIGGEIGLATPLMISPRGALHARPWEFDAEVTGHIITFEFFPVFVHQARLYTRQGQHRISGDSRGDTRHGCN